MQTKDNKTKLTATIALVLLMASVMLLAIPAQPAQAQLAAQQPVSGPLPAGVTLGISIVILFLRLFLLAVFGFGNLFNPNQRTQRSCWIWLRAVYSVQHTYRTIEGEKKVCDI